MFFLTHPSDRKLRRILDARQARPFLYAEVGATREGARPEGYPINHHRGQLGYGREMYERACEAIRQWAMYRLPWTTLCWPTAPIEPGQVVGVLAKHFGFWSFNPCRIVYVLDEADRYGFAFGTLPGHSEAGEERFTVELHPEDGAVWYEIYTFAKGHHPLTKLAPPAVWLQQQKFGRDSVEAMQEAVRRT